MAVSKTKKTSKVSTEDRKKAFREAMAKVSSELKGHEPLGFMNEIHEDVEFTPTGSLVLDSIIGGGFPVGRVIEIYGENASGKTSIALTALGNVQKAGGNCFFIDAEQAFDPIYARKLGVDTENLGFSQPIIAEEALTLIASLAASGQVDMIVVDSVAALVAKKEFENPLDKDSMATRARVLSKALPKIAKVCNDNHCTVIFLNQIRTNVGVMYGDPNVTSGGKALAFAASQRIQIKKASKPVEVDGQPIGTTVTMKCVKNKVAQPYGVGETTLTFASGIDREAETFFTGEKYNILEKEGRTYRLKLLNKSEKFDIPENCKSVYEDDLTIKIGTSKGDVVEEIRKNKPLADLINKRIASTIKEHLLSGKLQETFIEE